jgi:hypothetical protein
LKAVAPRQGGFFAAGPFEEIVQTRRTAVHFVAQAWRRFSACCWTNKAPNVLRDMLRYLVTSCRSLRDLKRDLKLSAVASTT